MIAALQGVAVLELGQVVSAPYCGLLLAQLGADVIKIEPPRGDAFRGQSGGTSPAFTAMNRGKRSIVLDLKTQRGRAQFLELVPSSDVLIDNLRPDAMDGMGLGTSELSRMNRKLIHCSITGVGQYGPYRDRPGYDAVAQALSGLWSQYSDLVDPEPVGPPASDQLAGMYAAHQVLAALVARQRTGEGARLHVGLLDAALSFQALAFERFLADGEVPDHLTRARHSQSYALLARDGPFAVHLSSRPAYWLGLVEAMELHGLVGDVRFSEHHARVQHYDQLLELLRQRAVSRDRDHWVGRLTKEGVPCAPILDLGEAQNHEQVRTALLMLPDGDRPELVAPALPALGSRPFQRTAEIAAVPALGGHNHEVLGEFGK